MHRWLLGHRILGPYLIGIQTGRGIPLRAKIITLIFLWATLAVSAWHVPLPRSEEHTSELQSLMRISYAVFCLKKKKIRATLTTSMHTTDIQQNVILTTETEKII